MRRLVWRAAPAALIALSLGCAAAPPPAAAGAAQHRWDRLAQRLRRDTVVAAPAPRPAPAALHRLQAVAAQSSSAVVSIESLVADDPATASPSGAPRRAATVSGGTGVVIGADGLILTNAHVVRGASDLTVVLPDGSRRPALYCILDDLHDLAVVRIASSRLEVLEVHPGRPIADTPVVAIARRGPDGACQSRCGVVSRVSTSLQEKLSPTGRTRYDNLIESTAAIEPGFSGGPWLDARGQVVGLTVAMYSADRPDRTRAYAVPLDESICDRIAALVQRARQGSRHE